LDKSGNSANIAKAIVLYDGYCVFCSRVVQFIQPRQKADELVYNSLQSEKGQEILKQCGLSTSELDTFVLYDNEQCYTYSTGALRLSLYMRFPWRMLSVFLLVPTLLRRPIYQWVARNRYQWFGEVPRE